MSGSKPRPLSWFQEPFPTCGDVAKATTNALLPEAFSQPPHRNSLASFLMVTPTILGRFPAGDSRPFSWESEGKLKRGSFIVVQTGLQGKPQWVWRYQGQATGKPLTPRAEGRERSSGARGGENCGREECHPQELRTQPPAEPPPRQGGRREEIPCLSLLPCSSFPRMHPTVSQRPRGPVCAVMTEVTASQAQS